MDHLFVYGSLAPGASHEYLLTQVSGVWTRASVRAHYQDRGFSEGKGYPALVPDEQADWLRGYVYSSQSLHEIWDDIDEWEGEEYVRVPIEVQCEDGSLLHAQAYVLRTLEQS
ncbi:MULTISPECIES: gamma-glutamylcyclotransferase family protein [Pseudovibrio]|uniref:gamma-glutamylcyclotransferase family protein n=1 Tax=Stappiaceae TaxID=2821832 RepID=UPI0023669A78|nr:MULTISPECIES: gamma-glutamylcyclotransferase family protein [Pseudovibrio]MDD7908696.1 gamma-glutamylcyclotransferase [Pseudovibrio exalbescens]MDX5592769.1 gamma-glutamylcyclotransferase family protein [Pseudovibrio sp. SPO723]